VHLSNLKYLFLLLMFWVVDFNSVEAKLLLEVWF
jgi:hypothetical protein